LVRFEERAGRAGKTIVKICKICYFIVMELSRFVFSPIFFLTKQCSSKNERFRIIVVAKVLRQENVGFAGNSPRTIHREKIKIPLDDA
jgi:hypothetical protein